MIRSALSPLELFYWNVYIPARLARRPETTKEQYALTVKRFDEFTLAELGRHFSIDEITDEHVDLFKVWRKASAATVNKDLRNLRALVNLALRRTNSATGQKYRTTPIDWIFEQEDLDEPEAWSIDEFRAILQSCNQETGSICGVPASKWWRAQQLTILNTSARITAVMLSRTENLNLQAGTLKLPGSTQKSRKGQIDRLHDMTLKALWSIYDPERPLVFPWPYDQNVDGWPALNHAYRRILKRAGLPTTSKDLFHKLRRTNATYCAAAAGIEAARDQLRHSHVSVTARYIDATKFDRPAAKELLPWEQIDAALDRQMRLFG